MKLNTPELGEIIIPYSPRQQWLDLHTRTARWAIIVAHRRSGKTVSGVNDMLARALCCTLPEPRFAYVNAYLKQAKEVAWDYFKFYGKDLIVDKNEGELWVKLKNDAKIGLFGADNADSIRGKYLDGAFGDEYQLWAPGVWSRVIRPMLADRRGWGLLSGTPMGKNSFYKMWEGTRTNPAWFRKILRASESGILSAQEIAEIKADPEVTPEDYAQEFECDFNAAVIGAYYGKVLQDAEITGRIKQLPYDPQYLVYTGWDLGRNDHTAIWCAQIVQGQPRIINCYANRGQSISHYIGWLKSQGYTYAEHYLPHDGENEYLIADGTIADAIQKNHIGRVSIVPRTKNVITDINKVRQYIGRCWFDATNLGTALEMLRLYRSEWKEKDKVLSPTPKHDESSHYADGFRTLIMGFLKFEPSGESRNGNVLTGRPNVLQTKAASDWDIFGRR